MSNYFIKKYSKIVIYFLFSIIFLIPNLSLASNQCFKNGYTVLTLNGVLTNESGAIENRDRLKDHLPNSYKNEPVNIDFLLNPSHIAGLLDFTDALAQGFFHVQSDYDLTEMIKDASNKITTQKVLLVGHSQGNFYANNLYSKVAGIDGGIPKESVRVYAIGTPATNVAGKYVVSQQDYITSDTDKAIAGVAGTVFSILPANVHIDLQKGDDFWGHDFTKVYLKYQADKIVSDIGVSFDKLKTNNIQNENEPCVNPPAITIAHKIQGLVFAVADPVASFTKTVAVGTVVGAYNVGLAISNTTAKVAGAIGSSIRSLASLISDGSKNLTASIGGLNIGGNVINALDDSANTSQNTDSNTNKDTTEATPPSDAGDPMLVEFPDGNTPPNSQVGPVNSGAGTDATEQNNSSTQPESSVPVTETKLASTDTQDLYKDLLPGSGGGGTGAEVVSVPVAPIPRLVPDITSPVITLLGNNSETVILGSVYSDAGATATDDVDGDITANIVTINPVDVNKIADYTIAYNAKDAAGNSALQIDRLVHVVAPALVTTTIDKNTILTAGEYNYGYLIITNGATLTLAGDTTSPNSFKGVKINAVNITIDAGSSISADGKGYDHTGPGSSSSDAGASYGGLGERGALPTSTYGSAKEPISLGSGGYGYFRGGGAIRLVVSDTFTNNGKISANGDETSSGGSIYVTAKNITGNGNFLADGGHLHVGDIFFGSGGGGRIAIYYHNSSFTGTTEAKGGCGSYDGNTPTCAKDGTVGIFDETKNDLYLNNSWKFIQADAPFNFNNIYISNGAKVTSENGVSIVATNNLLLDKNSTFSLAENQILNIPTITIDGGSTLTLSGSETITANTLIVNGTNSMVTIPSLKTLSLNIPNITIGAGAFISADSKGYGTGVGPGSPTTVYDPNNPGQYYAGASYGGKGGGSAKAIYGSKFAPVDFGSGGNGSYVHGGGGVIRMIATGNFINNGTVSADGDSTSSGGSIYITANVLDGTGVFRANSGGPYCPFSCHFPGGGGRIAIYYKTYLFTGMAVSSGWNGYSETRGQDGTVYIASQSAPLPSSAKQITSFYINGLNPNVFGVINESNHTIALSVPFDTGVSSLNSIALVSADASIIPASNTGQNFSSPATYTVTAEDGSAQDYVVTVTVTPDPNPPADTTQPVLVSAKVTSVNMIEVTFSKDINGTTVNTTGSEFAVAGYTVSSAHKLTGGIIILTLSANIGAGETPSITFTSTNFKDLAGNQAVSPATVIATNNI